MAACFSEMDECFQCLEAPQGQSSSLRTMMGSRGAGALLEGEGLSWSPSKSEEGYHITVVREVGNVQVNCILTLRNLRLHLGQRARAMAIKAATIGSVLVGLLEGASTRKISRVCPL